MTARGVLGRQEAAQTQRAIRKLRGFVDKVENQKAIAALSYVGEKLVAYSKENGPWEDRTSNLRNSISFELAGPRLLIFFGGVSYAIHIEFKEGYWVLSGAVEYHKRFIAEFLSKHLEVKPGDIKITR